ncbi:MAG: tRNA threonylcarbamoyladenosine dehydratase [Bacteroidales bacterium]|nr:tRNA threonylcarbamoyladenosine dehydratase [Bacteroidales bacterium]
MDFYSSFTHRSELLLGTNFIETIKTQKVIIFGLGGVGSWCAESLVRSGIENICIIDPDTVHISNINRQLPATFNTIGMPKTEVVKERLLEINPNLNITALQTAYTEENHASFKLAEYDYIIDAIDSISNKVHLIQQATQTNAKFFSSMGAALKIDATKIKIADFWEVHTCPLAAILRKKIRKMGGLAKSFKCVYSSEVLQNKGETKEDLISEIDRNRTQINGTTSYIPPIFGLMLSSLVIQDIYEKTKLKV